MRSIRRPPLPRFLFLSFALSVSTASKSTVFATVGACAGGGAGGGGGLGALLPKHIIRHPLEIRLVVLCTRLHFVALVDTVSSQCCTERLLVKHQETASVGSRTLPLKPAVCL